MLEVVCSAMAPPSSSRRSPIACEAVPRAYPHQPRRAGRAMRETATPTTFRLPATGGLTDDVVTNARDHPAAVVALPSGGRPVAGRHRRRVPRPRSPPWPRGWSPPGSLRATGWPCCRAPATSGRCWTTRSGSPAASRSRSTRRPRPSRSAGSSPTPGPTWPSSSARSSARSCVAPRTVGRAGCCAWRRRRWPGWPRRVRTAPTTSSPYAVTRRGPTTLATVVYTSGHDRTSAGLPAHPRRLPHRARGRAPRPGGGLLRRSVHAAVPAAGARA